MSTEKEKVTGIVLDMKAGTSDNPKAPVGTCYVNKLRLTVWDKDLWESLVEGEEFEFFCSVVDNEYNGKTYKNRNVVSGELSKPLEKSDLVINDMPVVIDESIKEIHMPRAIIDYLKEKFS